MFTEMTFPEASDLYQDIKRQFGFLYELFGEAGIQCIADALHVYACSGYAEECCGFDLDFCRLFTLVVRESTGHDLLPSESCLTEWAGLNRSIPSPNL